MQYKAKCENRNSKKKIPTAKQPIKYCVSYRLHWGRWLRIPGSPFGSPGKVFFREVKIFYLKNELYT